MDGREIEIEIKVGEEDQLYESITAGKIQKALKKMNLNVKSQQINLEEPIQELGEFVVPLTFKHNLEAEIRVIVTKLE